jgi:hypothetical protein
MVFGTVGLEGEVAGSEMLGEALGIVVVNNHFCVEPDLNVGTKGADAQGIPLEGFAVFVFGVAFVEPVVEVKTYGFVSDTATDVDLKTVPFLFGVIAEVETAVVFAVFVDFEFEAEVEVLEFSFGEEEAGALGVPILAAEEDAVLVGPLRSAEGGPSIERLGWEERKLPRIEGRSKKEEEEKAGHRRIIGENHR